VIGASLPNPARRLPSRVIPNRIGRGGKQRPTQERSCGAVGRAFKRAFGLGQNAPDRVGGAAKASGFELAVRALKAVLLGTLTK